MYFAHIDEICLFVHSELWICFTDSQFKKPTNVNYAFSYRAASSADSFLGRFKNGEEIVELKATIAPGRRHRCFLRVSLNAGRGTVFSRRILRFFIFIRWKRESAFSRLSCRLSIGKDDCPVPTAFSSKSASSRVFSALSTPFVETYTLVWNHSQELCTAGTLHLPEVKLSNCSAPETW